MYEVVRQYTVRRCAAFAMAAVRCRDCDAGGLLDRGETLNTGVCATEGVGRDL